jgi:hypothetical protein
MTISVVACADSAKDWHKTPCDRSIGCNDAWKFGYPTTDLMVANWPVKFQRPRFEIIKASTPERFWSSVDQWRVYFPSMIKITLNSWDGHLYKERPTEFSHSDSSPFIATSMAYKFGATNIILWGVEMITHPLFNPGNPQFIMELRKWDQLINALAKEGVKVWLGAGESSLKLPIWKG